MLALSLSAAPGVLLPGSRGPQVPTAAPVVNLWTTRRWLPQWLRPSREALDQPPRQRPEVPQTAEARWHRADPWETFQFFDSDDSGYIDASELYVALWQYGIALSEEGASEVLGVYKPSVDGRLNCDEFAEIVKDLGRGMVVITTVDASRSRNRRRPSDEGGAGVVLLDDLLVDADLLYDRLEAGARLHYCASFEPRVAQVLSDEAALRGTDGPAKVAEWRRTGQLNSADADADA